MQYRNFCIYSAIIILLSSCTASKHLHDPDSFERQKELVMSRSGNFALDAAMFILTLFTTSTVETDLDWAPKEKSFRKIKIINPENDTLFVNMLTDLEWDENNFCDFMDIRIPPKKKCKLLLPEGAFYNIYFSTTPRSDDDEFIEVFTGDIRKVVLKPGMTVVNDTLFQN